MKGGITMLNFFVGYFDPAGVAMERTYQVNTGREHHRLAAAEISKQLEAEGCTPELIARIPGDYTPKELEQLCENGLPRGHSPLCGTLEIIKVYANR
jgi:hypothetical protein